MKILSSVWQLIRNHPLKVIFVSIVIALLFAAGAPSLELATGNETLIEEKTEAYQDNQALEKEFGGESIIVLYEAKVPEDLLTIETVEHMDGLEKQLASNQDIYAMISPNTLIKQISAKQSEKLIHPGLPQKQETLDKLVYGEDGQVRDVFSEVVFDSKYMLFIVKLRGNVEDAEKSKVTGTIKKYLNDHKMASVQTLVSGKPVLDGAIRTSMKASMQKMMALSIIFMVLVLTIVFRVKWRLLPLIVILLAVLATVGLMGWLSIPMTMVSMAVLPILIGLGIDYAIQFQSRYSEEIGGRSEA